MTAFWDLVLCSLVEVDWRFRGEYSPHFVRKSLQVGGDSGAVRGESLLVGGLKVENSMMNYGVTLIQTENI
jgi:hypothetical protein